MSGGAAAGGAGGAGSMAGSLSMILGGAQTGLGVANDLMEGKATAAMYKYKAELAKKNATAALIAGQSEEGAAKAKTTRTIAEQLVAQAANGLDVATGSPLAVRTATQIAGDYDAAIIHYNALREAQGYNAEAENYLLAAKNAKRSSKLSAFGTLLSGASALAGKYSTMKQSGAMGGSVGADPYARLNDQELSLG